MSRMDTASWSARTQLSVRNGGMVGLGYGTYKGLQEGKAAGAQGAQCTRRHFGRALVQGVAKRSALTGLGFGVFFAICSSSLYHIERARNGKRSLENSLAAGLFTGAVLAIHTRRAPVVALSAALSGGMMVGVDATAGFWRDHVVPRLPKTQ